MLNVFEKEFDVTDMTENTIENLFKQIGIKADKPQGSSPVKRGGDKGSRTQSNNRAGGGTQRGQPAYSGSQYD